VPCRHRPKQLEREAFNADEQIITSEGDGEEAWVATHSIRQPRSNVVNARIPDIEMQDADMDDEIRDMDMDDIPGMEDMQMPSDDDSDDENSRKRYMPPDSLISGI
jgi:hypothetical protein